VAEIRRVGQAVLLSAFLLADLVACRSIVPTEPATPTAEPTSIIVPVPSPTPQSTGTITGRATFVRVDEFRPFTTTDGRTITVGPHKPISPSAHEPALSDALEAWVAAKGWPLAGRCTSGSSAPAGDLYCALAWEDASGLIVVLVTPLGPTGVANGVPAGQGLIHVLLEPRAGGWAVVADQPAVP
jgi:hypothetical protein